MIDVKIPQPIIDLTMTSPGVITQANVDTALAEIIVTIPTLASLTPLIVGVGTAAALITIGAYVFELATDKCECPEGTTYNPDTNTCEPNCSITCSDGFAVDLQNCSCYEIPPPPVNYSTDPYPLTNQSHDEWNDYPSPFVDPTPGQCTSVVYNAITDIDVYVDGHFYSHRSSEFRGVRGPIFLKTCTYSTSNSCGTTNTYKGCYLVCIYDSAPDYTFFNAGGDIPIISGVNAICDPISHSVEFRVNQFDVARADGSIDNCISSDSPLCFNTGTTRQRGVWKVWVQLKPKSRFKTITKVRIYQLAAIPGYADDPPSVSFDLNSDPIQYGIQFQNSADQVILNLPASAFEFYDAKLYKSQFVPINL